MEKYSQFRDKGKQYIIPSTCLGVYLATPPHYSAALSIES
jgi:hypothetical protein